MVDGDWGELAGWMSLATAGAGALVWRRPLVRAVGAGVTLAGIGAGGLTVGAAAAGAARLLRHPRRDVAPWLAAGAVGAAVQLGRYQRKDAEKRRSPSAAARERANAAAGEVMRCMPADRVRVLGPLAREFALCSGWHSSVPGATWPNRNFLHAATSAQSVDIEIGLYDDVTVFEMLEDEQRELPAGAARRDPWRIYFDGIPQVIVFEHLLTNDRADRWRGIDDLLRDLDEGTLPTYAFVEPRHNRGDTSSYHPGNNQQPTKGTSDFARGEELVRQIYSRLAGNAALFERTVLVVTFDEHGGFFDRVSPPETVHPATAAALRHPQTASRRLVAWFVEQRNAPFDFKRLGMRVPTIVISAHTAAQVVPFTYDHASVIATLRDLFAPHQQPLTKRDRRARPFWDLCLGPKRTDVPDLPPAGYPPESALPAKQPRPPAAPAVQGAQPPQYPTTGDELSRQLDHLPAHLDPLLDERGAPPAPEAERDEARADAAANTDQVAARVEAWRSPRP